VTLSIYLAKKNIMSNEDKTKEHLLCEVRELKQRIANFEESADNARTSEELLRMSERSFRMLFERAPLCYQLLDSDACILNVNKAWLDTFGYSRAEVLGRWLGDFMTPQSLGRVSEYLTNSKAIGDIHDAELEMVRKDGLRLTVSFHSTIGYDERGSMHFHCILADITNRKRMEEELQRNQRFLQAIIDTEPECVKLVGSDGTLIMMNPAGLAMIEADSLDQVKGKCIYPLIAEEHREAFKKVTDKVFRGENGTLEFEMNGMKGGRLWLETHAVPLYNERNEVISLLAITRNITEKKALECQKDELIISLKEALAKVKTLTGFLPICSSCKQIRDDKGYWNQIESYIRDHSEAEFTHSLCPECASKLYPEIYDKISGKQSK
jgi:PAS domain S-box-containing protein